MQCSRPSPLGDPRILVRPGTPGAVPAAPSCKPFTDPSSSSQACAILVDPGVGDDAREAAALGFGGGMRVQLRAAVPAQHRVEITPDTKPVHLDDAAPLKAGATGLPDSDYTHQGGAVHDTPLPNRHA